MHVAGTGKAPTKAPPNYNREEELQAKRDEATLVKNSGRGMRKGDARRGNLLIDYKFTAHPSYTLNFKAFHKHYMDAYREGFEGVVVSCPAEGRKIAMVDWEYLKQLEDNVEELINRVDLAEGLLESEHQYQAMMGD